MLAALTKWTKEIRSDDGSSIATILVLIVLASTLAGLVVSLSSHHKRFLVRDLQFVQAGYDAEAGVEYALSTLQEGTACPNSSLDLSGFGGDSTIVTTTPRGGFCRIVSTARVGKARRRYTALAGAIPNEAFRSSIVLGDRRAGLTVTGNAVVGGQIVAGKSGVREASLKGRSFRGSTTTVVDTVLTIAFPSFDSRYYSDAIDGAISAAQRCNSDSPDSRCVFVRQLPTSAPVLSRSADTLFAPGDILVNDRLQPGSTVISAGEIVVRGELGDDIVLIAASIVLKNADGSAQLFARERVLTVDSRLRYPSLVFVRGDSTGVRHDATLTISKGSQIDGSVIFGGDASLGQVLLLDEKSTVRGLVYTLSLFESYGRVIGTAAPWMFYFYESPADYLNWIRSGSIDVADRPEDFRVPVGFSGTEYRLIWRHEDLRYEKAD